MRRAAYGFRARRRWPSVTSKCPVRRLAPGMVIKGSLVITANTAAIMVSTEANIGVTVAIIVVTEVGSTVASAANIAAATAGNAVGIAEEIVGRVVAAAASTAVIVASGVTV